MWDGLWIFCLAVPPQNMGPCTWIVIWQWNFLAPYNLCSENIINKCCSTWWKPPGFVSQTFPYKPHPFFKVSLLQLLYLQDHFLPIQNQASPTISTYFPLFLLSRHLDPVLNPFVKFRFDTLGHFPTSPGHLPNLTIPIQAKLPLTQHAMLQPRTISFEHHYPLPNERQSQMPLIDSRWLQGHPIFTHSEPTFSPNFSQLGATQSKPSQIPKWT